MELDALITDLALILIVAGVVDITFQEIETARCIGLYCCRFFSGSQFRFFPTIVDEGDIIYGQNWVSLYFCFLWDWNSALKNFFK